MKAVEKEERSRGKKKNLLKLPVLSWVGEDILAPTSYEKG